MDYKKYIGGYVDPEISFDHSSIDNDEIDKRASDMLDYLDEYYIEESIKIRDQIGKSEIEDVKTVISSLNDGSFKDFKFIDMVYCDIRYRSRKPIAFITIRAKLINNSTVGYVSLAVNPKYQNQGIGKSLATKAVSWFKQERGIQYLEWHCLQDNEASRKLANSTGFREYIAKRHEDYAHYTMESPINESYIEESVIVHEDLYTIIGVAGLALYFGTLAAVNIHDKIKPYIDEKKFVYLVKNGSLRNSDKSYGYKSIEDAIIHYAMLDLGIRTAEKGVILYSNKTEIEKKVKLFKFNKKKEEVLFDGTYEELCNKYNVKLKELNKSKFKGRDDSLKKMVSVLKQEISKYSVLKKGKVYDYSNLKSVPDIFHEPYFKFINGTYDSIPIYNINLWDIGMKYNPRSDEGKQYADENIFIPVDKEVIANISKKLPKGYSIDTDGDWDSLYIILVHKVSSNESLIEEEIENEFTPTSFVKRSSLPAKNQKNHARYLRKKAHSNKTNNATTQNELPKYNQIGELYVEEVAKSVQIKPIFIVTSYTNTPFGKAIKTFTHSEYTHAAISFDTSLEKLYSFNADSKYSNNGYKGGISRESLSSYIDSYEKTIIQVNCIFLKPSDFDIVQRALDNLLENEEKTKYAYSNIINILIGRAKDTGMAMVCSQFVAYILHTANIELLDKPDNTVTPKDLSTITNPRVYKIFEGYAKDYEKKRIDRIFRKLKTKALLIKESLLKLCV